MADKNLIVFRARIATSELKFGFITFLLDPAQKKAVESYGIVGSIDEFSSMTLDKPYHEYADWVQRMRFYSKYDIQETQDLERYVKNSARNIEYMDKVLTALKKNKIGDIEYTIKNDMINVLGEKEPKVQLKFQKIRESQLKGGDGDGPGGEGGADGPGVDPSMYIPLAFSLSPIRGTYLTDLRPGDEVCVRLTDFEQPRAQAFLSGLGAEDKEKTEDIAVLKSMQRNPAGGMHVFLTMGNGSDGLVIEEEPGIKVKRPSADLPAESDGETSAAVPVGGGSGPDMAAMLKNPKVLAGIAAGVVTLIVIIVVALS